jgi:23S rRNA (pseudouridine1915-N3)-methyltransferase
MQVTLAQVGSPAGSRDPYEVLVRDYLKRCSGVVRCETQAFRSEAALLDWLERRRGRTPPAVLLLDGRGRAMTSEALAEWLSARRNEGTQQVVFAVGPADGWSEAARSQLKNRAGSLSLGPMTLAHQLARLVIAEQLYRACTILTGHPYHRG